MIRINLANTSGVSKKGGRGQKDKSPIGKFLLVLLLLFAAGGGGYYYIMHIAPQEGYGPLAAFLPPPVPKPGATPATMPSSQVRTQMAENVVRETGDDTRANNKLNMPYADMTMAEKINYEALYARNVFDMVTRNAPPGIAFKTLEIDSFQTLRASGRGLTREMVREMFTAYRNERGELMPRPQSYIRDDVPNNFRFTITFQTRFGLDAKEPFQALDHLTFRQALPNHVGNFTRLAAANNYKLQSAPVQASVAREGEYRRVIYRASGMSTYRDFHKFVLALYNEKVPAAFQKITMTPIRDEQIRIEVEVLFTVRE